ncbi:MAG: hypothetical protein ACREB3_14920, partial [Burkholderiales bacterium]
YLAFRAYDSDPAAIRGRVVKRDDVYQDDYVSLYLDTYDDRQRAYHFAFNPLGIQLDGVYTTDRLIDLTWNAARSFSNSPTTSECEKHLRRSSPHVIKSANH